MILVGSPTVEQKGMTCSRGRVAPDEHTRLRLFADSGGFCQNPDCLRILFLDAGGEKLHIAEMAHIFAASDQGPRANRSLTAKARGAYENLLLLCPLCHRIVDKLPKKYPDSLMQEWKQAHKERIAAAFGAVEYHERQLARDAIEPLLAENKGIFDTYGPLEDYRFDPESDMAGVWRRKVRAHILPDNRKLLAILDANRRYLISEERTVLEQFRQHVDDLEQRHIVGNTASVGTRFPGTMNTILGQRQ